MSFLSPGTELKRFRAGLLPKIAVGVLLVIPLIYGALYLWAFWAPDKHMDRLPIALVNEDVSATLSDGTQIHAGADIQSQLLADGQLGWVVTDADDAAHGVAHGDYTFSVTIPADFSASVASIEGDDPRTARIVVNYNETNSFLATTLGRHAMVAVRDAVAQEVTQQTATTMLDGVQSLANGLNDASDAATQINQGAHDLSTGVASLASGLHDLAAGADDATSGSADLAKGLGDLSAGAAQLNAGLAQLKAQTATLPSSTASLSAGAAKVSASLTTISQLAAAHPDWTLAQLGAALSAQGGSLASLAQGAQQVAAGNAQLATSSTELTSGVTQLAQGAQDLSSGAHDATSGAQDLHAGLSQLDQGAHDAEAGAADAAAGASQLSDGTQDFSDTVAAGAAQAPHYTDEQIAAMATVVSQPVVLDETTANQVQGFGEGFAPFFIALATFVGALITWLILRPLPRRPLATKASGLRTVLTGYVPAMVIAAGQVVIMMAVLIGGVGLRPKYWLATSAFVALTTLAFLALQQMFIVLLGTAAGRVVSLVLLMAQLSSSGGTYPVETTPKFFSAIHPFMPATYVVNGLRALMGGGIDARFWVSLAFMAGLLVVSLAVSSVASARQKVWTIARLHPELSL